MAYNARYANRRRRAAGPPRDGRWMDLRYPGTCQVCNTQLEVGTRAFYDPADRTVTCTNIECAKPAGLTTEKWMGSPASGGYVTVLSEHRMHRNPIVHPEWTDEDYARGHSATQTWKQKHGRCEDAPACGCCSEGLRRIVG